MKKQHYWFQVNFGKWDGDSFDPESSCIFVTAWSAIHAAKKAENQADEGELVISVEYRGYPQV